MPYTYKKVGNKYCVYKKDGGAKVGCTAGNKEALHKYLGALHANESINESKDHEVSMAIKQLQDIIVNAAQLYEKLGNQERDIAGWISDHISQAQNFINQANYGFHELDERVIYRNEAMRFEIVESNQPYPIEEAEYQGRTVKLGKPTRGDTKKFKVYVRNPKGNVVKVEFGQRGMSIKKNNPARRRSFRARHNCDDPGPRHKARYWSCRKW